MSDLQKKPCSTRPFRPDAAGVIAGALLAGAAGLWMFVRYGVLNGGNLGVGVALLVVVAGVIGLGASSRS
ncbi:hypothetical protein OG394_19325 [Kribbella sp. NBC_01245]|uniref:hypothetical protein n=1 Tax=Kribbella sp. NBC_01245 TaxID=2903578 RepID=UPI002E2DD876|nr:hypothetical protein [Kribbella sp. NBC_01245]